MPSPDLLPAGEIHLHMAEDPAITAPRLLAGYEAMLSAEEAVRRAQFRFERHRHQFLVTRALLRETLSRYRPDIDPVAWRFETNDYGRPRVAGTGAGDLDFNLSHTDGRVVLAICRSPSPGVDIERLDRQEPFTDIARQFFAEAEVLDLSTLAPTKQRHRFFQLWTLKEAYIKARGMGLSIPLKDFSIHFPPGSGPGIHFAKGIDDASRWQLWSLAVGEDHVLSLALADAGPMRLRLFKSVPLVGSEETVWRDSFPPDPTP